MALSSESSFPGTSTSTSEFCAKCRPTGCFSSPTYSASSCPYKLCSECCELEVLDAQIMEARNVLTDLSKKRHELTSRINRRHDRFTSSLPIELISDIFALVSSGSKDHQRPSKTGKLQWNPVLRLGAVCRRWRDITLSIPQLWTMLTIVPRKHGNFPDIAEQWLSRSLTLPLTLKVFSKREDHEKFSQPSLPLPYGHVVRLLRSHAGRWKDLTLRGPMTLFQVLLTGLEDKLSVDSLKIFLVDAASHLRDKIIMDNPLFPQRLLIDDFPLQQIPIQYGRLTHLEADYISSDALVHIFRHAHNLQNCLLHIIQQDAKQYPIFMSPVTNTSVKYFKTTRKGIDPTFPLILPHLTLPSLETLECAVENDDTHVSEEMTILADFIDRSQPPLHNFIFSYFDYDWRMSMEWYRSLPSITSLELRVHEREGHDGQRTQGYLEALGAHVEPMVLPRLRHLTIHAEGMNTDFWNALAAMFPDHKPDEEAAPVNPRPLNTVKIYLGTCFDFDDEFRPEEIIPEGVYARLCAIQNSGVMLQVFDENETVIFGPQAPTTSCLTDDESSD